MARAKPFTVKQFLDLYPNDEACLDAIMSARMGGDRMFCPGCGAEAKFYRVTGRRAYVCQFCGDHYYPCAGTIFQDSRTSLLSWFYAIYLFTTSRHGVPAKELERQLGVTYKTAWRMGHQIRKLMDDEGPDKLQGHVEIDEAYFGPRKGRKLGRATNKKHILVGMIERDGNAKVVPVLNARMPTLRKLVNETVQKPSAISTDEFSSYNLVARDGYEHGTVKHSKDEYVRGPWHVNSIEGFWSRLKSSIGGTHVHVSGKYLPKYAAEFAYRYSNRKEPEKMFSRLVSAISER